MRLTTHPWLNCVDLREHAGHWACCLGRWFVIINELIMFEKWKLGVGGEERNRKTDWKEENPYLHDN